MVDKHSPTTEDIVALAKKLSGEPDLEFERLYEDWCNCVLRVAALDHMRITPQTTLRDMIQNSLRAEMQEEAAKLKLLAYKKGLASKP